MDRRTAAARRPPCLCSDSSCIRASSSHRQPPAAALQVLNSASYPRARSASVAVGPAFSKLVSQLPPSQTFGVTLGVCGLLI
ncbi:hypothetical protein AAHA92_26723 [Salvia divinorum]|uniref:Uncharacterized protein n=1 Tax=Salvia divinorum TaxID=28513 RepID=A0ABD1G469_SALDI